MAEDTAPIIVTAELGRADQAWADALRRHYFPSQRNILAAHLTLFHHLAPSLEDELRTLLRALCLDAKPKASIGDAYSLGRGVAIAVVSPDLLAIRAAIADRFARYLIPQDRHEPRLHITIQNKVEPAIARATLAEVKAALEPRQIEIGALACWHYRGGPWSPIARQGFRGQATGVRRAPVL